MLVIAVQTITDNKIKKEPVATETATMKSPPRSRPMNIMTAPNAVSMPAKTQMTEELDDNALGFRSSFLTLRVITKANTKPTSSPTPLGHSPVKIKTSANTATVTPHHSAKRSIVRLVGRAKSSLMAGIV
jgi:hypothetical protein